MSDCSSGVKFRAYPGAGLAAVLRQWIGSQRFIYNGKVEEDRLFASQRRLEIASGTSPEDIRTPRDQQYAHFKDDALTPWLSAVPSQVLRNGAYRWYTAKQRQLSKLARAPRRRNRRNFNSVLITSELFRFKETANGSLQLEIGTRAKPLGVLPFKAHRPFDLPASIVVREVAGQWFVSFSFSTPSEDILRSPDELAYELAGLPQDALAAVTLGLDRNVRDNCVTDSRGQQYGLDAVQLERIRRKEIGARRHQRRLARSQKGSNNRKKIVQRLARKKVYAARVRQDFSHKTTTMLASSDASFFALEALNIAGMVRRPKARRDASGKWQRNGARAKAGLNRAILLSCWGEIYRQLGYKAARKNKLVGLVPAAYSSQECSQCGHTHPGNRDVSVFACQRCGFTAHADHNAACVIAQRRMDRLLAGEYANAKPKKRTAFRRKNIPTGGLPAHVCESSEARCASQGSGPQTRAEVRPEAAIARNRQTATTQKILHREVERSPVL